MKCLSVSKLPDGNSWVWEVKLDGYRALAVKSDAGVTLFSRQRKSLNRQFPYIVKALGTLPDGTVLDGELVALDDNGRPAFNLLQNFKIIRVSHREPLDGCGDGKLGNLDRS
jgi:ATP-dependent DNA ligase